MVAQNAALRVRFCIKAHYQQATAGPAQRRRPTGIMAIVASQNLPDRCWSLFDAALNHVTNARYRNAAEITDYTASAI
jgi:hypothetical protein